MTNGMFLIQCTVYASSVVNLREMNQNGLRNLIIEI